MPILNIKQKNEFKKLLLNYFDKCFLKSIFYEFQLETDDLAAADRDRLAYDLVHFCDLNGWLEELLNLLNDCAPQADWSTAMQSLGIAFAGQPANLPNEVSQTEQQTLEQLLEGFISQSAAILLAQEHRLNRAVIQKILQQLQQAFGAEAVRHVLLPNNPQLSEADFFQCVAQRLGLSESVSNRFALEQALLNHIDPMQPTYWLITGLERCELTWGRAFADVLRNVSDQMACHAFLCGGERLAELRYGKGALSELSHITEVEKLPEIMVADVQRLAREALDSDTAAQLLALSGGHPVLVQKCVRTRPANAQELLEEPAIVGAFQMVLRKVADCADLPNLLQQSVVSPEQRFVFDSPLLAALFWQNLLCNRGGQLVWRCEAVRLTGLKVVACL